MHLYNISYLLNNFNDEFTIRTAAKHAYEMIGTLNVNHLNYESRTRNNYAYKIVETFFLTFVTHKIDVFNFSLFFN